MIIARLRQTPVEIEDALNGYAIVRTLDSSRPFTARVARDDPESPAYPEYINVDWVVVATSDLVDVTQECTCVLPEQTCPICQATARKTYNQNDELPY